MPQLSIPRSRSHRRLQPAAEALGLMALGLFALCLTTLAAAAAPPGYEPLERLLSADGKVRRAAAREIAASKDLGLVPGIVDGLFFAPSLARRDLYAALEGLTGETQRPSYYEWVEYVGAHPEITPKPGYVEWKASLLAKIDARFPKVLYPGVPARIRLEEVVWGGVALNGIPSLDAPEVVPAAKARYLEDDEAVFGVAIGAEQRAYPLRHLSWHEMTNDTVGGEPITLSYCTLCGSGILYSGRPLGSNERYVFGTSGLLYRSNKLMFDRATVSLWSNITGEPVIGPLVGKGLRLEQLPMVRTSWREWKERYPNTTVLALDQPGGREAGFRYLPGAADRARRGVRFPVWQKDERLARDAEVFALRLGDRAKAYPLDRLAGKSLVQDRLGETGLVLSIDAGGGIRAYLSGDHRFEPAGGENEGLRDERGVTWHLTERALVAEDGSGRLERIPGHVAFWFGWFGFVPQTEIYTGSAPEAPP